MSKFWKKVLSKTTLWCEKFFMCSNIGFWNKNLYKYHITTVIDGAFWALRLKALGLDKYLESKVYVEIFCCFFKCNQTKWKKICCFGLVQKNKQ